MIRNSFSYRRISMRKFVALTVAAGMMASAGAAFASPDLLKKYNCTACHANDKKMVGPAYKDDIYYDKKLDNGLNNINSELKKIKVIKIKAVYKIDDSYTEPEEFWYNPITGIVYDLLDYPIGKVYITDGIPNKLNKDIYIIDQIIDIPEIDIR